MAAKFTDQVQKALLIIRDKKPTRPGEFAYWMWEDSPKWNMRTKCGNGVTIGGGMNLAAGGFLGRLKKDGWIEWEWSSRSNDHSRKYYLTDQSKKALLEAGL